MKSDLKDRLADFLEFYKTIEGYEKGEGQLFINRLFVLFGFKDATDAGGKFEYRNKYNKTTKFEDFILVDKILIEMKSRKFPLKKAVLQAREYWNRSYKGDKTKYVMLCNFDEIWIFNWFEQDRELCRFAVKDIAEYCQNNLSFLFKEYAEPIFENNVEKITTEAVSKLIEIYHSLLDREVANKDAVQKFILQLLVCLFADSIGLFPKKGFFGELILECKKQGSTYDLFRYLFIEMRTPGIASAGRFKGVDYFNGGIFKEITPIELNEEELLLLEKVSHCDWSKIEPAIFGNILEYSMDKKQQHDTGSHYTYEQDIMKIIRPTIIEPIMKQIKDTKSIRDLKMLRTSLGKLKILDPACGSGNFLYIALRELKSLELEIINKIETISKNSNKYLYDDDGSVATYSLIETTQFYGMDTNKFAVELAKVTLSFGKKTFNDLFCNYAENSYRSFVNKTLPFDDLDKNIVVQDALFSEWIKADIIIGNPPFLGGKHLKNTLGDEYVKELKLKFPEAKGQADFCTFWFQKAHDSSARRIGLVATNSISQGLSRDASLKYIIDRKGIIINAISSQKWSGSASVHVSIVNWVKSKKDICSIFLDNEKVDFINSSLRNELDYTDAKIITENLGKSFQGCELAGKGFVISAEKAREWIKEDKKYEEVLKPMIDGMTIVSPSKSLDWVIDFNEMSLEDASLYTLAFEHVKKSVKPERDNNKELSRKTYWWKFGRTRPKMRKALEGLKCYFCLPKIAKYTIFQPIDIGILPCEANMVIASDDFFVLGILNSKIHLDWVLVQRSTLGLAPRYTNTTCFMTFPFPSNVDEDKKQKIRAVMKRLNSFRLEMCLTKKCIIASFYNDFYQEPGSELFKLHKELDKSVCDAYGWKYNPEANYNSQLYELNQLSE